ncbi:hypothetical protein XENTR_v10001755 [Xenopus tropicalis]|uniref:Transmembrane protein 252 n=1 Tax=Xenopus tropicalis TaxID=8364 RepID=A0A6I8SRA6_XENTR|nr:transmembrane protein 252 [Xenopus tropicalis]KAE8633033.1 hypothetical protein XENTR_v10001755 [Xenopus tropicalis]|eukprot:XP_004910840.1 PREDICTED: transmembrane protein 252 [Xenopus tropicalis]
MKMKKSIYTVLRFLFLITGFSLVCLGAFYISSSYVCNCKSDRILAYFLLPIGFILLLTGIFWSTYHEANQKSLFHSMIRRIHSQQEVHVETVDRPDFYPPSYDSVINEIRQQPDSGCELRVLEEGLNIPPPLYTESAVDIVDEVYTCNDSPPSYEASVQLSNIESSSEREPGSIDGDNSETCD